MPLLHFKPQQPIDPKISSDFKKGSAEADKKKFLEVYCELAKGNKKTYTNLVRKRTLLRNILKASLVLIILIFLCYFLYSRLNWFTTNQKRIFIGLVCLHFYLLFYLIYKTDKFLKMFNQTRFTKTFVDIQKNYSLNSNN